MTFDIAYRRTTPVADAPGSSANPGVGMEVDFSRSFRHHKLMVLRSVIRRLFGSDAMATASIPSTLETLEQRVVRLLAKWRAETAFISSSTVRNANAAYQELIGLGMPALPFVIRDLEQTRDGHLSKALSAITSAHPVPAASRGKIAEIADAWLAWATENGARG